MFLLAYFSFSQLTDAQARQRVVAQARQRVVAQALLKDIARYCYCV